MTVEPAAGGASIEARLASARGHFLAFVRRRVSDPELAEDILQDALLRAVRSAPELRDEERLVAWFYAILRNAIIDAYRRRDVRQRRLARLDEGVDLADEPSEESTRTLCECFRALIPTMKPGTTSTCATIARGPRSGSDSPKRAVSVPTTDAWTARVMRRQRCRCKRSGGTASSGAKRSLGKDT